MSIWLLAGLALVVESIVLTWVWALCRAAATGDNVPTVGPVPAPRTCMRLNEMDDDWGSLAASSGCRVQNAAGIA